MILKKENLKISFKFSEVGQGLDLKLAELGTDGENIFIGKAGGNVALTLPIGTTLFWMAVKFSDQNNGGPISIIDQIFLPPGWSIANGSKVEDSKSVYHNLYLPNLTSDIFIMGTSGSSIGNIGGTNDASHKHNIAHYHKTFNGANNQSGYVVGVPNHQHNYSDFYGPPSANAEEGDDHSAGAANPDLYPRTTSSDGAHSHGTGNIPAGDTGSGLYIDNTNHVNQGNSRNISDTHDFTENRPNYISGIYIIRTR